MYYVTVDKNGEELVRRKEFDDYAVAMQYLATYYEPRLGRGVLPFTTEVINGEFARSYVELADPETVGSSNEARRLRSIKFSNAFNYDGTYFFLVESDVGIQDADNDEDDVET